MGFYTEMACSESGAWFWRNCKFNGYVVAFCKWTDYTREVIFPTKVLNRCEYANAPLYNEVEEGSYVQWGFTELRIKESPGRIRLPA